MRILDIFKKTINGKYTLYKPLGSGSALTKVGASEGLTLNEISLYLNKGINKRGEKVGETKFVLKDRKTERIIENHYLLDLLDKPNKSQTGHQFFKLASIYRDATGFAIIKKVYNDTAFKSERKVLELQLLNPTGVTFEYELDTDKKAKAIKAIKYNFDEVSETIPFEDCIYWYNPDPKNILNAISIITAGVRSVNTDLQMTDYQYNLIKNGGAVDSVLSFKNNLTKEQLLQIKEGVKSQIGGSEKAGSPLILGGDAQYTKIALSPQELAYLESKNVLYRDLAVITGVPLSILGVTSNETYSNAETAYKIFLRETIKPIVSDLVNVLDWRLVPKELELSYIDPTPEDNQLKLDTLKAGNEVNALTLNEKREMLGLDPVKGGDDFVSESLSASTKAGVFVHPLRNKDFRDIYYRSYIKSLNSQKNLFKSKLNKYLEEQKERILTQIKSRKQVKIKTLTEEIFNEKLEVILMAPLLDTMKEIAKEAGQEVMDTFAFGREYNFSTNIDSAIARRFKFFSEKVNETTAKDLEKEVSKWFEENGTVNDLVEKVEVLYKGIEEWRAETIVNTEVATVIQEAKNDSYKQIGIKTKIWVWSPGIKGGVRDDHKSLDGDEVPFDTPFSNGLMYPHDPNADAGEVINCECTI